VSADLNRYTSADAVADLEDLRAAMRYRQINLVAVSYGVRVALLYMREHPQRVRSAVLRAAYPVDYNIISAGAHAADAQLAQVLDDCAGEAACRQAFPRLRDQLQSLDAQLASAPARVSSGEASGSGGQIIVTRELFQYLLLAMMQASVSRQYVPLVIATAATNGLQPFAVQLAQLQASLTEFPVGMYLSVLCAEDAPRPHDHPFARTPFGTAAQKLLAACSNWPVRPEPARTLAPFTSDVPTLILSGSLDPVTPAQAAERLAGSLRRSRHIILPATAHGPMFPECVRPDVAAFIRRASAPPQGNACSALTLPPFAVPATPPPAPTPAQAPAAGPAAELKGTWDLQWQTRRGPESGGYLVISQDGRELTAQLHGRGSIRASGTMEGNRFILRGSRLFVPYTLTGTVSADRIEGTLKVMSVERQFAGQRRATSTDAEKP
jgi:pimeloyl-ACP methyl ester carboxylesterase